ncbi:amino acid ABC transporter permease [Intestinirhabdus alba]|jgi:polar amino acid transport system permease protein|uniref:ABC transporter permease subunit n=1 Tax=Intestinirhabdus alba TaxID=2899544 RepID=A0A6L6IK43_9ENTR|nr:amino acid ABC transporter permease [Intestinirhabdus alba]MTH46929.1 ABC transporter permease subunit [Intestinirhabdus alba]
MIANLSVIIDNLDYLLWGRAADGQPGGVLLTLMMALGSAALALPGGVLLASLAWRFPGIIRRGLFVWAEFIRGIPLIFVIFWMWYLLPMLTGSDLPGAVTVTLALAWFTAASVMHSVYAGLNALPAGQYDAAMAQGFRPLQALGRVLLPQTLRNVLPSLIGIGIGLLKDTSLAFIVNVPELTTVAGQVNSRVQIYPAAIFIFTGLVYYLLCFALEKFAHRRFATARALSPGRPLGG